MCCDGYHLYRVEVKMKPGVYGKREAKVVAKNEKQAEEAALAIFPRGEMAEAKLLDRVDVIAKAK